MKLTEEIAEVERKLGEQAQQQYKGQSDWIPAVIVFVVAAAWLLARVWQ